MAKPKEFWAIKVPKDKKPQAYFKNWAIGYCIADWTTNAGDAKDFTLESEAIEAADYLQSKNITCEVVYIKTIYKETKRP